MPLELVTGFATAPDTAAYVGATFAVGNSGTIRSPQGGGDVMLLQAWMDLQGKSGDGGFRLRSPSLHDNVQGLRFDCVASEVDPVMPWGIGQRLKSQDTLALEIEGSATAGDIETVCLLVYYADSPGGSAKFATWEEIKPQIKNLVTINNTLALGTAGGYSGSEAINAEQDLLKADTYYALLGYTVDVECACIGWTGTDTGNLRVGGPGNELDHNVTVEWFKRLSQEFQLPCIPVFNSANKSAIAIDGAQDENGADTNVTQMLAELG